MADWHPQEVRITRGARKRWQRPQCHLINVDGAQVRVLSEGPLSGRDREAVADLIRAARRRYAEEGPADG